MRAISTATEAIETEFDPIPVSDRAFLAAANALCSRCSNCPATVPCGPRHGECLFYLAQNLRLAHHHGIQAGGHAEQMTHRFAVAVLVQVRPQNRSINAKVAG